jgi:hypothetical protein
MESKSFPFIKVINAINNELKFEGALDVFREHLLYSKYDKDGFGPKFSAYPNSTCNLECKFIINQKIMTFDELLVNMDWSINNKIDDYFLISIVLSPPTTNPQKNISHNIWILWCMDNDLLPILDNLRFDNFLQYKIDLGYSNMSVKN